MHRPFRTLLPALVVIALTACGGGGGNGSTPSAPTGFNAHFSDQSVTFSWNYDPSLDYWLYIGPEGTTPTNDVIAGAYFSLGVTAPSTYMLNANGGSVIYNLSINAHSGGSPGSGVSTIASGSPVSVPNTTKNPFAASTSGSSTFNGVAYGNPFSSAGTYSGNPATYVAVGAGGSAYTGILNTTYSASYTPNYVFSSKSTNVSSDLNAVAYDTTDGFLAVGASGAVTYSPDGLTWTAQTNTSNSNTLRGVLALGGTYLVSGDSCTLLSATSINTGNTNNKFTWTSLTPSSQCSSQSIYSMAYAAPVGNTGTTYTYIAGSNGLLAYSTNFSSTSTSGVTWTAATISGSPCSGTMNFTNITYQYYGSSGTATNPLWVAVGNCTVGGVKSPLILYSTSTSNPTTWVAASLPAVTTNTGLNAVTAMRDVGAYYGQAAYVTECSGCATNLIAVGDNGVVLTSPVITWSTSAGTSPTKVTASLVSVPGYTWTQYGASSSDSGLTSAGAINLQSVVAATFGNATSSYKTTDTSTPHYNPTGVLSVGASGKILQSF
jgi:hypothetical protein